LKGHERSITYLTYNHEGDLIFTCSKGTIASVWWSETGERIGTYKGHNGTVWSLDVNRATTRLVTGSADNTVRVWDVETGRELQSFNYRTPVRSVAFATGDRHFISVTDQVMGQVPAYYIYKLDDEGKRAAWKLDKEHEFKGRASQVRWGNLNQTIYIATDDGILVYDTETSKLLTRLTDHKKGVNSLRFSQDYSCFITSSSDQTAKLWDAKTNKCLKTYESDRPVNDAAIHPNMELVIIGGGQEADKVTTSNTRVGHFQVRFYHKIYEEEIGTVKGHFGPINTLSFTPDGKGFSSGAEDGFIRVHWFDDEFNKAFVEADA